MAQTALRLVSGATTTEPRRPEVAPTLAEGVPVGRLVELSGHGAVGRHSAAVSIVAEVQAQGDTVAWIQVRDGGLFVPDLEDNDVCLESLVVVHVPSGAGVHGRLRATELLLRSGAFGLVVLDLDDERPAGPPAAWQGRLLGLARQYQSRVVLLSRQGKDQPSLGPLIGLRFEPRRERVAPGRFSLQPQLLKNKSGAPFALRADIRRAPWGLR